MILFGDEGAISARERILAIARDFNISKQSLPGIDEAELDSGLGGRRFSHSVKVTGPGKAVSIEFAILGTFRKDIPCEAYIEIYFNIHDDPMTE